MEKEKCNYTREQAIDILFNLLKEKIESELISLKNDTNNSKEDNFFETNLHYSNPIEEEAILRFMDIKELCGDRIITTHNIEANCITIRSCCDYEAHEQIKPIFKKPDLLKKY